MVLQGFARTFKLGGGGEWPIGGGGGGGPLGGGCGPSRDFLYYWSSAKSLQELAVTVERGCPSEHFKRATASFSMANLLPCCLKFYKRIFEILAVHNWRLCFTMRRQSRKIFDNFIKQKSYIRNVSVFFLESQCDRVQFLHALMYFSEN